MLNYKCSLTLHRCFGMCERWRRSRRAAQISRFGAVPAVSPAVRWPIISAGVRAGPAAAVDHAALVLDGSDQNYEESVSD